MTHTTTSGMDNIVHNNKFEKFADIDNRFLQRVPAISGNRETSPPNSACAADAMDVRLRSGSMSSAYHAEYEESDSDSDRDCNAIDMSVIKNAASLQMRERAVEQMDIDMPMCGRSRMAVNGNNIMESEHGSLHHHQQQQHLHPPPPQLIMRDPHAPREDLRQMTNNSPLSSSASSSPSLLLNGVHESHGRPNGLAGPALPPPPFLSQLGQAPTQHLMQQMQHHGGIILGTNDSKGRHNSFSSVISSDGAVSPPPHTLPNPSITQHSNPLNQHQLSFVPQHIPHDLVHKMSSGQKKKLPTPIPKECKDEAYWERRKRNNESAKRSRELRRIKEQQTTLRVLYLEQENLQLRTELGMLRSEVDKLRQLLYVTNKQTSSTTASPGRNHSQQLQIQQQQQQQLQSHPLNPQSESPDQVVGSGGPAQDAQYLTNSRPSASPPLSRRPGTVPMNPGEHAVAAISSPHQRLPPIATLQQPQLHMRRIILASPPSVRPIVASSTSSSASSSASSSSHPVVVSPLSRSSPSPPLPPHAPQGRDSRREVSISPISPSSPDATDLSPLPHRVALTPPSPTEVCVRPLELGQPASDPQTSNTSSDSSCQSHSSGGSCSPPTTTTVQQHPLQPAILRHKKARPSSPMIGGVSLSQHHQLHQTSSQASQQPHQTSSMIVSTNKQLHAMAQREFRDSQQDGPPRGIDVARLRHQRNPNLHYEPRLVTPSIAA